jgi:hypothetical protein
MMLLEIMVTQCSNRTLYVLVAGSINFACMCVSCHVFLSSFVILMEYIYLKELLETFSIGYFDVVTGFECAKPLVPNVNFPLTYPSYTEILFHFLFLDTRMSSLWLCVSRDDNYEEFFWDVMPCSVVESRRRFRGTYCLHLNGRKVNKTSSQQDASLSKSLHFGPEDGGNIFLRSSMSFYRITLVTSQEIIRFMFSTI